MSNTPPSALLHSALEAALKIAGETSWNKITLIEIAKQGKIDIADLYGVADKDSLVDALESWADKAMSAEACEAGDTPRERLFDTIMRRFELFEEHRAGVLSLMKARDKAPRRLAALLVARSKSAQWALACAGLDDGRQSERAARQLGVAWVIAKTERAWRADESGDFARTMATLDAELASAEERLQQLARLTGRRSKKSNREETSSPEAPPTEMAED